MTSTQLPTGHGSSALSGTGVGTSLVAHRLAVDELSRRCDAGTLGLATRARLMRKAFRHTADYDAAIAAFFAGTEDDAIRRAYSLA